MLLSAVTGSLEQAEQFYTQLKEEGCERKREILKSEEI